MTEEEIRKHPNFRKLTNAVGIKEKCVISVKSMEAERDSLFLLTSDGVHKFISHDSLRLKTKHMLKKGDMEETLRNIRQEVYANNAPDNLSLVAVKLRL